MFSICRISINVSLFLSLYLSSIPIMEKLSNDLETKNRSLAIWRLAPCQILPCYHVATTDMKQVRSLNGTAPKIDGHSLFLFRCLFFPCISFLSSTSYFWLYARHTPGFTKVWLPFSTFSLTLSTSLLGPTYLDDFNGTPAKSLFYINIYTGFI